MGNSKSKKVAREPDKFFEREKWREQKRDELRKKNANPANKRIGMKETPAPMAAAPPAPARLAPAPSSAAVRSYDHDALERMRFQLYNDSDAFLLNNILLSVQFFENFEREFHNIKDSPISKREHIIDEAMVRHHKHIFFADRLQECVHDHVRFVRSREEIEPLVAPRLFVIYDNVEASEPGDTSDYSAVLDAPFYKLRVEDCREPGYVKLKKLEVLESTLKKDSDAISDRVDISEDSVYTDSEKESNDSDDSLYVSKGKDLLQKIKSKLSDPRVTASEAIIKFNGTVDQIKVDVSGRRRSGPIKQISSQAERNSISNLNRLRLLNETVTEEHEKVSRDSYIGNSCEENYNKQRKSILKNNSRRYSGPTKEIKAKALFQNPLARGLIESSVSEDTETSGYRSTSSSRQNESSETESDYGYSTITESSTPKRIELSLQSNFSASSGVLPDECWSSVNVRALNNWSDDDDDDLELNDTASKESLSRSLYETIHYLNSVSFMTNFVDNFMIKLGIDLGLSQNAISNAMTQGASVYCESKVNELKSRYEVIPALIAAWPNAANQWIIRERRIIQNPRTNFNYQWPTKYMVSKAIGFGCLLVPLGFRPKRGKNPDHQLQWRITFPAAERYLESCLAHSHTRCYLFALTLHKTFMENESSKVGIDASHIKNHLFWQCEDNYAKWPEDRLGETLRLFLKSFYAHFGHAKFPNYFMENCNEFKCIPKPLLLKLQRKLADILESPVMHVLKALEKVTYTKKEFYPPLNIQRLYQILTCKNPLRILNPNIQTVIMKNNDSSDSDDEESYGSFWERAKAQDKHYQWKRERQRQMQEKRKAHFYAKKQKASEKQNVEINKNIILPKRMDVERRRLVLEFFIPHFIAMARTSEKFEAIKQAIIYLEQAHRLCILLQEEPAGETSASDYLDIISDKLGDCQRKLVDQSGFKLPRRTESHKERLHLNRFRKQRPRYENIVNQDSPTDSPGIHAFSFVDVHVDCLGNNNVPRNSLKLSDSYNLDSEEESKL